MKLTGKKRTRTIVMRPQTVIIICYNLPSSHCALILSNVNNDNNNNKYDKTTSEDSLRQLHSSTEMTASKCLVSTSS